jgi:hypothetical protein
LVANLHQRLSDVIDILDVDPPGHIGHAPPGPGGGEQQHREELGPQQLPVVGVLGPVAADIGGVGEHAADPSGVGIGAAVGQRRPSCARHPAQAEGVVDPDGPQVGPVGAGGPQDVGFDGGGDQVALPLEDGRDDQAVGLERPWRAEGQHRVVTLHGQVKPAEETVAEAVAAAQDDPPPLGPEYKQAAQLPPAGPLGASFPAASAAGPGGDQPDQQPVGQGGEPEGEDGGGVHAHRPGEQWLHVRRPGVGWVVPGAGQPQQHPEHVDQPDGHVLMLGAEEDGGDLADQPNESAGGEQQHRDHKPEGVGDVVVLGIAVTVTPHPGHLLAVAGQS